MCVTLHDASLGRTTIAGWRNPARRTHCLLYGNEPRNRVTVPNAMILHIPVAAGSLLTRDNFIPTHRLSHVLDDMWAAAPKFSEDAPRSYGGRLTKGSISVFDMGAYTWVAASQASAADIRAALDEVTEDRRPRMGQQLIEFYLRTWPRDALAIGCFSSASGDATEPAAIEYVPQDWDVLRMPAVDAHGEIPDLDRPVLVSHRIIVGTDELGAGGQVTYRELGRMDPRLAGILPARVAGIELDQVPMANGDFYVDFGRFADSPGRGTVLRAHGAALTSRTDRLPVLLGS